MSGFLRRRLLRSAAQGGLWAAVKIGAGGYVTGIDRSDDGSTMVCRTDTAGAYIWDATNALWKPLITAASFAGAALDDRGGGCVEIRVAPSDPTRIYMSFQGDVWISRDSGATWTATGLNYSTRTLGQAEANKGTPDRYSGYKMAVDPSNIDVVYYATPNGGIYQTSNAGGSWSQISLATIPAANGTVALVAFGLPSQGITAGKTNYIYAAVGGSGVYQSQDAGGNWTFIGGPTAFAHMKVGLDGTLYAATNVSSSSSLWTWNGSTWTNISPNAGALNKPIFSVAFDPSDASRIVALSNTGQLHLRIAGTWQTEIATQSRSGTITWLDLASINNSNPSDMIFDLSGNLWQATGLGVFTTPFSGSPSSLAWDTDATFGIENMTTNEVSLPPNGKPLLAGWDQSVFRITDPTAYNATHSPTNAGSIIHMAWGIDYAYDTPDFAAYLSTWQSDPWGYYTTDGGVTWTVLPGSPSGGNLPVFSGGTVVKLGGCVAVSTPSNFIFVPSNNALPWVTADGGTTWTEIVISGVATSGETGYGNAYYSSCKSVAADRVTDNCFYLYNYKTQKTYRSTDGGVTWAQGTSGSGGTTLDANAILGNFQLVSVPGQAGHLFLAGGQNGNLDAANPGPTMLQRSTDGGETWSRVGASPNSDGCIKEPLCVCFGAAKPGQSYPAVYFAGWLHVSGAYKYGFWRSFDNCSTWEFLGDYPTQQLSAPKSMDASKEVYGLLYSTLGNAGYIYRTGD